jgi:hypothetical protein
MGPLKYMQVSFIEGPEASIRDVTSYSLKDGADDCGLFVSVR